MAKLELALNVDGVPAWFGYAKGAGHMILSSVVTPGGDHVGGNDAAVSMVCTDSKTLETARLVEKFTGDARCKRCLRWSESLGYEDALKSAQEAAAGLSEGPSVADTLDSVLDGGETSAPVEPAPVRPDKAAKVHAEAVRGAKEKRARKRAAGEAEPDPVRCVPNAPAEDNGDGTGKCRVCSWGGPLKSAKDLAGQVRMVMTAHWRGGKAPKSVTLPERKVGADAPLAESPATVDTGNKSADDMIGGTGAGMLPGRTSLTRGKAIDADKVTGPSKRRTHKVTGESLPSSTTMDAPLGRERTDKRSVEEEIKGDRYGYLTYEEVGKLSATERRRYWRHVARNRARADRSRELIAARAKDERTRAERMTGKA